MLSNNLTFFFSFPFYAKVLSLDLLHVTSPSTFCSTNGNFIFLLINYLLCYLIALIISNSTTLTHFIILILSTRNLNMTLWEGIK